MWYLLVLFLMKSVLSQDYTVFFSQSDPCIEGCQKLSLNLEISEQAICQKGCRHYLSNTSTSKCYSFCEKQFDTPRNKYVCTKGCNAMLAQQQIDFEIVMVAESVKTPDSGWEQVEMDLMSDTDVENQVDFNKIAFKIPETHIRTMPINKDDKKRPFPGDWLDCASRNSGIPRWFLLTAILFAVLMAVWVGFSSEKKSDCDDEKLIGQHDDEPGSTEPTHYHVESEKV